MKGIQLFILINLLAGANLLAQTVSLDFVLIDQVSSQPVENAHIFQVNTTFGSVSNKDGQVYLNFPTQIEEDILISHVSYNTLLLEKKTYQQIAKGDTIWLQPNNFDVSEIVVRAKRTNQWKKNYKRFLKTFLGQDKAAGKCELLNPEVLRFEDKSGKFTTTAVDLLKIQNDYLGYEIKYFLNRLVIKSDGSAEYLGKANYKDLLNDRNKDRLIKNRKEAFENSAKFFFQSLIQNKLVENGFEMEIAALEKDGFKSIQQPLRTELLAATDKFGESQIRFPQFLKVINKNTKQVTYDKMGVRTGGLESQKFSNSQTEDLVKIGFATSYLYKITPFLTLNEFGNILNSKAVKEYGFWADRRMAYQLPFDFGNTYTESERELPLSPKEKPAHAKKISDNQKLKLFINLIYEQNATIKTQILAQIEKIWGPAFLPVLIEFLRFSKDEKFRQEIVALLSSKTQRNFGQDHLSWVEWLWKSPPIYGNYYSDFKGIYYQQVDPIFKKYFYKQQTTATIRLDEVVWGGVRQDGIPPLRQPKLIAAQEADYLSNTDVVFGVYINGVAKAYPKRILAWHEFFTDTFGKAKVAGVYCTLCGTMIAYDMIHKGTFHNLGTSGFLYRSNKLMYDKTTQSLWNTIEGQPVLGPLANSDIQLATYPVETTTWGAWKKRHPTTQVLSLSTGYTRDYSEGAAYADYFATDQLMFPVPRLDQRLPNKAEVLIIRAPNYRQDPLAISINYLKKKKWYVGKIGTTNFMVIADKTGAASAFKTGSLKFVNYKKGKLTDENNQVWTVDEDQLIAANQPALKRLSTHNIFWFAWFNSYPETRLVK